MGSTLESIAKCRAEIDQSRFLAREAADRMLPWQHRPHTRKLLSMVKAVVPNITQQVVDRCMQLHGGLGASQDAMMPAAFLGARCLRWADGPDEVHWRTAGRLELSYQQKQSPLHEVGMYGHYTSKPFRAKW